MFCSEHGQAIGCSVDLLAFVKEICHISHGLGAVRCAMQANRHPTLHVTCTQAEKQAIMASSRQVPGFGNGVQMPSDDHPLGRTPVRHRDHRIAITGHCQMWQRDEGLLNGIGDHTFVAGFARDIDEGGCQIDDVTMDIETDHIDTVSP